MNPAKTATATASSGVGIVAASAAIVSFYHVQKLARSAGEPEITAWLLPLSIDGAIAAAAAVILADSRANRRPTLLTWLMLCLGLGASLAANIASAEPPGLPVRSLRGLPSRWPWGSRCWHRSDAGPS